MSARFPRIGRGLGARQALLMLALLAVFALCAWLVGGLPTVIVLVGTLVGLYFASPRVNPGLVMGLMRARPLAPQNPLHNIARAIAIHAGLKRAPDLYLATMGTPGAFTVGDADRAAIALSASLLRLLDRRELTGVLAHEIAHVAGGDTERTFLVELIRRLVGTTAFVGLVLMFGLWLGVPGITVPFWVPLTLILGPSVAYLLQCAISRATEFAADANGAALTGDPEGLAAALYKIDRASRSVLDRLIGMRAAIILPTIMQTHPPVAERLERLSTMRVG